MREYQFKCFLKSDIILKSLSATENNNETLEYIPGAKFLGIVAAQLYRMDQKEKTLRIFHSDSVRFGDAHPFIHEEHTFKIPYAWFLEKGANVAQGVELMLNNSKETTAKYRKKGSQLKQLRKGYLAPNAQKVVELESTYSIKSSYDAEKRRSKDAHMFGYNALQKGSVWSFSVQCELEDDIEELKSTLEGVHRIGRSRSAQYGLVEILFDKEIIKQKKGVLTAGTHSFYAKSNWCFYDTYGRNTAQPNLQDLGLPATARIDWSASHIKTRNYQTWNGKRYNRDADRMIIEKGSVFLVHLEEDFDLDTIITGLGAHKNEGFGEVLVNPGFLNASQVKAYQLQKVLQVQNVVVAFKEKDVSDAMTMHVLAKKNKQKNNVLAIDNEVNNFVRKYGSGQAFKAISKSQWGQIRKFAKWAVNEQVFMDLLFDESTGYLMHGVSEEKWRQKDRRNILKNELEAMKGEKIEFTIKIASQMAKL